MVALKREIITEIWTGVCSNLIIRGGMTGRGREIGRSKTITVAGREAAGKGKGEEKKF